MRGENGNVKELLQRWRDGDSGAFERLLPLVYADLRDMAARALNRHGGSTTLQTTALLHEMLMRLLGKSSADFQTPAHLFNAAARMMRNILVDRARAAASVKRGGEWQRDEFTEALELPIPDGTDMAALDDALTDLESMDERMAQVVQLRFFIGLDTLSTAAALGVNERTVHRDWIAARAWLKERLQG